MSEGSLLERKLAEIGTSPYLNRLGIRVELAEDGAAQIVLPYRDANTNRGGSIHGGTIASALVVAGSLAAASSQSPETSTQACDGRPLNAAISFLRPAQAEDITARANVLRRGRDTVHVASTVAGVRTVFWAATTKASMRGVASSSSMTRRMRSSPMAKPMAGVAWPPSSPTDSA